MRHQDFPSRRLGYRSASNNTGAHRINQEIDTIPARTTSRTQTHSIATPPRLTPLFVPAASEAVWGTQNQFSAQIQRDSSPFRPFDLSDSDDDDDDLCGAQTTLEWDSHGGNLPQSPSGLSNDSYALSDDATQALEDVWADHTASQSQSTGVGYSSDISDNETQALEDAWAQFTASQSQPGNANSSSDLQRDWHSPSVAPSLDTLSSSSVPSSSPVRVNYQDEGADANHSESTSSPRRNTTLSVLRGLLELVWPQLPPGLAGAPLAIAWEFVRVALYCSVDLAAVDIQYEEDWHDQERFWKVLKANPNFRGRKFPDICDSQAWNDSVHRDFRSSSRAVVLTASMNFSHSRSGPPLLLELQPLKLEQSCRLHRRFGSDRFLDLRIPSLDSWNIPKLPTEGLQTALSEWLTQNPHHFLARSWAAFWIRGEGRKSITRETPIGPETDTSCYERVSLFATDGADFLPAPSSSPRTDNDYNPRIKISRDTMLQWLLQFDKNRDEPYLKLFSRISLGLTKTTPAFVFHPNQIRRRKSDLRSTCNPPLSSQHASQPRSSTGNVMNDGIARVSPSVMRKIRDSLGLTDTPCAIQARLGSAKGMWITDVTDTTQEDWIETYPSQEKWECNWSDELHRTLEVKACASSLRPATLNLQFLPILEARSHNRLRMRETISAHLAIELAHDLEYMKTSIKHPESFRQWLKDSSTHSESRVFHREVSFLGGLPNNQQDKMAFLVDGGFDPMKQKYLQDLVFEHQNQKCDKLREQLKIKISRSTYAFMVVDFWGILEPNEVQLCFSSKFGEGSDEYFDLDGVDVLVARSPAHLPSDIQKVRAVFRPELRSLKDVIIFSSKGETPLADMLSGGDYDGDKAWVCWDPDIVENFNGVLPQNILPSHTKPDFSKYLERDKKKVDQFIRDHGKKHYVDVMVEKAFSFSLNPKLLGLCTSYKERLCYHFNTISSEPVVKLSWLLGELADQTKNGIIFDEPHWKRFRSDILKRVPQLRKPAYKGGDVMHTEHIIDHLKFDVAKGVVDNELTSLASFYKLDPAHTFDVDLANYWNQFEESLGQRNIHGLTQARWLIALSDNLKSQLESCRELWAERMLSKDYRANVLEVYNKWREIEPHIEASLLTDEPHLIETVRAFLLQPETHHPDLTQWQLLKASMTFKMFYRTHTKFTWQVAGRQLQFIKALKYSAEVSAGTDSRVQGREGGGGAAVLVIPRLYAALRPDNKYIKRIIARADGNSGSEGHGDSHFLENNHDDDDDDELDVFEDAVEEFAGLDHTGLESAVGRLSMNERRRY